MIVRLVQYGSLGVIDMAICKCHDREFTDCNIDRIDRVGNKMKHASVLEHVYYSFDIQGISRALLQEISRTRIASPTVKSSRYTLGELKKESPFIAGVNYNKKLDKYTSLLSRNAQKRASKYIFLTGNEKVDNNNIVKLDMLRANVCIGIENDISKYEIPEAYKTTLMFTINARSLQNLLHLRTHSSALLEYQILANKIFEVLPETHKFLYKELIDHSKVDVKMTKEQYKDWLNYTK